MKDFKDEQIITTSRWKQFQRQFKEKRKEWVKSFNEMRKKRKKAYTKLVLPSEHVEKPPETPQQQIVKPEPSEKHVKEVKTKEKPEKPSKSPKPHKEKHKTKPLLTIKQTETVVAVGMFVAVVGIIGMGIYITTKESVKQKQKEKEAARISPIIPSIKPTVPIPTPLATVAKSPNSSPTPSTSTTTTCSYDLSASTGSVEVTIQPQSGVLVGDQLVELHATSGCNVLVNKSTDTDTRIAKQGNPIVNFSTVPPGNYQARARYKDQWTSYQDLSINSGQQTKVTITVSGDTPASTPTTVAIPKPTCYDPIVYPSATGTAPYTAQFQGQGTAGATGSMVAYEWDFTGDGSWDSTGSLNPPSYTYQNPGIYTVKMRVLASNGEYSDICQTTVTVN